MEIIGVYKISEDELRAAAEQHGEDFTECLSKMSESANGGIAVNIRLPNRTEKSVIIILDRANQLLVNVS